MFFFLWEFMTFKDCICLSLILKLIKVLIYWSTFIKVSQFSEVWRLRRRGKFDLFVNVDLNFQNSYYLGGNLIMVDVKISKVEVRPKEPTHPYYADFNMRLKSYQLCHPKNKMKVSPKALADAGFYYEGDSSKAGFHNHRKSCKIQFCSRHFWPCNLLLLWWRIERLEARGGPVVGARKMVQVLRLYPIAGESKNYCWGQEEKRGSIYLKQFLDSLFNKGK